MSDELVPILVHWKNGATTCVRVIPEAVTARVRHVTAMDDVIGVEVGKEPAPWDDPYAIDVETQGGGYRRCAICFGTDYRASAIEHRPACTLEFRKAIAAKVGA